MPSKRHMIYAVILMTLVLGYAGCFCANLTVGHLTIMCSEPGTPTLGYYFSDHTRTNRACYVIYWPLAKLYELYRPEAVFLPVSPFASEREWQEWHERGIRQPSGGVQGR